MSLYGIPSHGKHGGDGVIVEPFSDESQDAQFLGGKRLDWRGPFWSFRSSHKVKLSDGFLQHFFIDDRISRSHDSYGMRDALWVNLLGKEPRGSEGDCSRQILNPNEGREDDDRCSQLRGLDLRESLQAVHIGHSDVEQDNIRSQRQGQLDCLPTRIGDSNDLEPVPLKIQAKSLNDYPMVIGYQNLDLTFDHFSYPSPN